MRNAHRTALPPTLDHTRALSPRHVMPQLSEPPVGVVRVEGLPVRRGSCIARRVLQRTGDADEAADTAAKE